MKRLFGLILILIFSLALFSFGAPASAFAEEANDVTLTVTCKETVDGDLRLLVDLTKNDGICILFLRVEYDDTVLSIREQPSFDDNDGYALDELDDSPQDNYQMKSAPYIVLYTGTGKNVTATGRILNLVFHAKKDVQSASESIKLVVREVAYMPSGSSTPRYNTKYGEPIDYTQENARKEGGITVSNVECAVSAEGKISVKETKNGLSEPFVAPSEQKDEGANVGLIVGLAVGGAALITGIIIGGYFLSKKKKKATVDAKTRQ